MIDKLLEVKNLRVELQTKDGIVPVIDDLSFDLDYGAYRKYRRSEKTFAARKFNQLVDNLAQEKKTVIMKPSVSILKILRRRLRHVPFVKSVYHGLFK